MQSATKKGQKGVKLPQHRSSLQTRKRFNNDQPRVKGKLACLSLWGEKGREDEGKW